MYTVFGERRLRRAPGTGRTARMTLIGATAATFVLLLSVASPLAAQSLRGSSHSMDIQNRIAHQHDFTYIATPGQVRRFVSGGYLVPVRSNGEFIVHNGVSFPYAREEVRTFLKRLGAQYRRGCGKRLVVTSLTRPKNRQPRNASSESVHPTGMAVDLRRSRSAKCRAWLERVLLTLERQGVLEATREYYPPHYHIAVFPRPYVQYVASLNEHRDAGQEEPSNGAPAGEHLVRAGDTLWEIAKSAGISVQAIRVANELSSNRIKPGQRLTIPGAGVRIASAAYDYRVQRGDSLWEIAQTHSTSVDRIRAVNSLPSNRIRPGQVLTVPAGQ